MQLSSKVLNRNALKAQVADWRAAGNKITLANGCFDLLHVGHIRYIHAARRLGGKLVVAINADESVKKLKGEGRPLIPEIHRDIHAKGTDYTAGSVPERDAVIECGGRVEIVGDAKDHSATDIIRSRLEKRRS